MARKASSGLSKFDRVDNTMGPSVVAGGTRQRGFEHASCGSAETRGNIAVGPEQIGGSAFGIVTCRRQSCCIVHTEDTDTVRRVDRRAVCKFDQRKAPAA